LTSPLFCAARISGAAFSVSCRISCALVGVPLGIASPTFIFSCLALCISGAAPNSPFFGTRSLLCISSSISIGAALRTFRGAACILSSFPCIFFFLAGILLSTAKFPRALFCLARGLARRLTFLSRTFFFCAVLGFRFAFGQAAGFALCAALFTFKLFPLAAKLPFFAATDFLLLASLLARFTFQSLAALDFQFL
jgi:hypothetical protein